MWGWDERVLIGDEVDEKFEAMDAYRIEHDGLPDGTFFSLAEELHGWDADDWVWFSERFAEQIKELR